MEGEGEGSDEEGGRERGRSVQGIHLYRLPVSCFCNRGDLRVLFMPQKIKSISADRIYRPCRRGSFVPSFVLNQWLNMIAAPEARASHSLPLLVLSLSSIYVSSLSHCLRLLALHRPAFSLLG